MVAELPTGGVALPRLYCDVAPTVMSQCPPRWSLSHSSLVSAPHTWLVAVDIICVFALGAVLGLL